MKTKLNEKLTEALQAAQLAADAIRQAHKTAIADEPFAEITLLELIGESTLISAKLKDMVRASEQSDN